MKKVILFISLGLVGFIGAQEMQIVQIRTLCFQRGADTPESLVVKKPDGNLVEIELSSSFPTTKTKVPIVEGKIGFYAKGQLGQQVAVASVASDIKDVLILLVPAPATKKPIIFDTVVMDLSKSAFPDDGALVMNAYPRDVRAVIGEHRILLKPGMRAAVARPAKRNDYNMAAVVIQYKSKEEWLTAAETMVSFPEALRQLFITYADPKNNQVTFRSYSIRDL